MAANSKAIDKAYLLTQLKNFEKDVLSKKYDKATEIAGLKTAIETLNGDANTTGSVAHATAEAIASIVANAPEDFDTLKEMADWISTHGTEAATMNSDISGLKTLTGTIPASATSKNLVAYVKEVADGKDGAISAAQSAADNAAGAASAAQSTADGAVTAAGAAQNKADAVSNLVGSIPTGSKATTVVGYVDEQVAELAAQGVTFETTNINFTTEFNA